MSSSTGAVSALQRHMWFTEQIGGHPADHLVPLLLRLDGVVDETALCRALRTIAQRHEILRTSVVLIDGELQPVVRTADEVPFAVEWHTEDRLDDVVREELATPFDLRTAPPFRARLLRVSGDSALLCLTVHHLAFDDWSRHLVYRELGPLYDAYAQGTPIPELPDPPHYRDLPEPTGDDESMAYWRDTLADLTPFELLPPRRRPTQRVGSGACVSFPVPAAQVDRLTELGRRYGASRAMVLFAACQAVLRRYTGRDDVTLGTTWAQRDRPRAAEVIGPLINLLVLRGDLSGNPGFGEVVERLRDVALDAYEHADTPFGTLVEALGGGRDAARTPLFQILVGCGSGVRRPPVLCGLTVTEPPVPWLTSKYDASLWFEETADGALYAEVAWDTALYPMSLMRQLADDLRAVLGHVAEHPETRISELPVSSSASVSAGRRVAPSGERLHTLFERQATRTPNMVAIVDPQGRTTTYAELDAAANRLAHLLREAHGVGPEVLVGLCAERSRELVVGLLAILKAGGGFVPLDPDYPADRLAFMAADSGAPVLLVQSHLRDRLGEVSATVLTLNADMGFGWPDRPVDVDVAAESVAYVIYTSGSTGRPKGAPNPHRGIVNRLEWFQRVCPLDSGDAVLQKTPTSFDVSVWEFFWPLSTGARLVLAEPGGHRDTAYLRELIKARGVTTAHFVPAMFAAFLAEPHIESCVGLRRVVCSGEELPRASVETFAQRLPDCELWNLYGPTEAAIEVSGWLCRPEPEGTPVPIGRPIDNVALHVLDEWGNPAPVGVPGELYLGGVAVARGYHRRPALTAERFVPDPFADEPGARLYRTGDLARWRIPDGGTIPVVDFLGRLDGQIKLHGVRVELDEVEHRLRATDGVTDAAVVVRPDPYGQQRLVAYTTGPATPAELKAALRAALPEPMVPSVFVVLPALPLTPSGKLDRRALPEVVVDRPDEVAYVAPRTIVEEALADIWADVLGVPRVGVDDDFFALGGHSMLLMRAANRVRDCFELDIPLSLLFERPTVAALAVGVERFASALDAA